jgi:hypothetical protein
MICKYTFAVSIGWSLSKRTRTCYVTAANIKKVP